LCFISPQGCGSEEAGLGEKSERQERDMRDGEGTQKVAGCPGCTLAAEFRDSTCIFSVYL
jgi:hypothetical protein